MRGRGRGFGDSSSGASFLRSSAAITWSGRSCLAGSLGGPAGKQGGKGGRFARRPFLPNFRARQAFAAEAEALAGELEQAEHEGVDPMEQLAGYVESTAEALITMRDAKTRLQEVRRDQCSAKQVVVAKAEEAQELVQTPASRVVFVMIVAFRTTGLAMLLAGDRGRARHTTPKGTCRGHASPSSSTSSGSQQRMQLVETSQPRPALRMTSPG